ncbi:helix-turn-helix domain-containing protein [Halovenus marina]|uniref:helix-turn-helix domain-containing protein n=1 Tax=Halovenus marina TaxID=3396621 RepID=UPI003F552CD3
MPETRLELTIPGDVWIGDLSRQYPDATFRILAAVSDERSGVGLAEIESEDLSELLQEMAGYEDVSKVQVLNEPEDRGLVQFETTLPLLLLPARDSGVPLEMPFELSDGAAVWELTAPSDSISQLGEQLRQFDISFTIDYLQQHVGEEHLLTDSQAEIVQTAIEQGYYDTPRTCSLTELAAEVGRAKSTVSETLHRAEGKIIKQFFESPQSGR